MGCVLCLPKRHKHTPHSKKHGGSNLLSHTPPSAVPSAQTTLATGFEKDTGRNLAAITTATTTTPTNHHYGGQSSHSERKHPNKNPTQKQFQMPCYFGYRSISTSQLNTSQCLHPWPINPIINRGPHPQQNVERELISKQASRLDAFSGYPSRTWPTSNAPGGTTGTLEVRPSRSSRTRNSPSQFSNARSG